VICRNDKICIAELHNVGFSILTMVLDGLQCAVDLIMEMSRCIRKDLCHARLMGAYRSISCVHSLIITVSLWLVYPKLREFAMHPQSDDATTNVALV
jgi:hypothetical protein